MVRRNLIAVGLTLLLLVGGVSVHVFDYADEAPNFTYGPMGRDSTEMSLADGITSSRSLESVEGTLFNITVVFSYELLNASESASCAGAYVQLRLNGMSSFNTVRSGHTDDHGKVTFSGMMAGIYMARIETDDDRWVRVADGSKVSRPTFYWNTQQFTVDSHTEIVYRIADETRGAWAAYSNLRSGGEWLSERTGWERSQVTVVWPDGSWPHSHGNEIHLPSGEFYENAVWRRDIVLHEYAHCVHYELRGGSFPEGYGPDPHYIDSESSPGFAFTEGWAQFFERAVDDDPRRSDGSSLESTVFADGPFGHGDAGDMDGLIVEGAVANVLWDLYDGIDPEDRPPGSARGDFIDEEFTTLWNIMYDHRPESLEDIKRHWPVRDANITAVFHNSNVPMELDPPSNPNSFWASHTIGDGSLDSTISITWSGARDAGSGVLGYSILISTDANASPDRTLDVTRSTYTTYSLAPGTYYLHIRTVDRDGNWAESVYTIGPFVIEEGAVPVDDPQFQEGDPKQALLGLLIVMAVVGSLLLLVMRLENKGGEPWAPSTASSSCRYCGRVDHGGDFCPYCGGRLR